MSTQADAPNETAPRKPAGFTLPKPAAKQPVAPPTQVVSTDDVESDEAVSSDDDNDESDTGSDHEENTTAGAPSINMLINGPIEDEDEEDSDDSFVDEPPTKPKATAKRDTDAITAAAKRLRISDQKAGSSLPKAPRAPLPERASINVDELEGDEESDEAESTGNESEEESDDENDEENKDLTHLLLGGSASGAEDSDDDGEWQPARKGAKTRSLTKANKEATMEIDS